jgi:hypothetical protein
MLPLNTRLEKVSSGMKSLLDLTGMANLCYKTGYEIKGYMGSDKNESKPN